jgi:hypothetical protein
MRIPFFSTYLRAASKDSNIDYLLSVLSVWQKKEAGCRFRQGLL